VSAGKVAVMVFWDNQGVILTNYLPKGSTVRGEYYASELCQLKELLKIKRQGTLQHGVVLLQNNDPAHTAGIAMSAATECGYELLPHLPYSPDLALSDFYLFPKLKEHLHGRQHTWQWRYWGREEFLADQDTAFYQTGIEMLQKRWSKCSEVHRDYVKNSVSKTIVLCLLVVRPETYGTSLVTPL